MAPIELRAPASASGLLKLVATYCSVDVAITVADVADVEFNAEGTKASGLNTACRYIAGLSSAAGQLLGQSPEQQAKVAEWLSYRHTELAPLMDDKLGKVNDWLQTRTYLAGSALTLADLVIYAVVQPAACGFPVAQHSHFANLLRWYDWVHHTADRTAIFPPATFAKPRFVAPAPAPAPPPLPQPKAEAVQSSNGKGAAAPVASGKGDKKAPAAAAAPVAPAADGKVAAAAPVAGDKKEKKEKKKEKGAGAPATPAVSTEAQAAPAGKAGDDVAVDLLDIRVGKIVKVDQHPNADSLYVEEIDVGEEKPRQIVSGLVKFVPVEKMEGRRVVVLLNLKPAKMREVMSYGMVLCASNDAHDQVDPISPPEGAAIGERVTFEGYGRDPEPQLNPKKKQFERIAPDLITDASGLCTYKGVPFMTSKGPCTATIPSAHIK